MRTVITHFDGDPFLLNFWLFIYEKYWRGECNEVNLTITQHKGLFPESVQQYNENNLKRFPEISYRIRNKWEIPETVNSEVLKKNKSKYIGLIESDGFIFASGVVDQCFRLLEEGQDIVAPSYPLIVDPYIRGDLQVEGFMRCFFFAKNDILKKTDYDFYPKRVPANTVLVDGYSTPQDQDLDCFGWMSWQLALLRPKITYTPLVNLNPANILSPYSNFNWFHIRQMQSSALGLGGGEFSKWLGSEGILETVFRLFDENFSGGSSEFTMLKAVAFRLLFWDYADKDSIFEFAEDYKQVLEAVVDMYGINREKLYEIKGFYKGLMRI